MVLAACSSSSGSSSKAKEPKGIASVDRPGPRQHGTTWLTDHRSTRAGDVIAQDPRHPQRQILLGARVDQGTGGTVPFASAASGDPTDIPSAISLLSVTADGRRTRIPSSYGPRFASAEISNTFPADRLPEGKSCVVVGAEEYQGVSVAAFSVDVKDGVDVRTISVEAPGASTKQCENRAKGVTAAELDFGGR